MSILGDVTAGTRGEAAAARLSTLLTRLGVVLLVLASLGAAVGFPASSGGLGVPDGDVQPWAGALLAGCAATAVGALVVLVVAVLVGPAVPTGPSVPRLVVAHRTLWSALLAIGWAATPYLEMTWVSGGPVVLDASPVEPEWLVAQLVLPVALVGFVLSLLLPRRPRTRD